MLPLDAYASEPASEEEFIESSDLHGRNTNGLLLVSFLPCAELQCRGVYRRYSGIRAFTIWTKNRAKRSSQVNTNPEENNPIAGQSQPDGEDAGADKED
jgi:hypothetical protein